MTAFVQGQLLTAAQLNAAFAQTFPAGAVSSYSGTIIAGTTQASWFTALGLPSATPGSANGLATLNGSGVVPFAQIPASIVGALYPLGGWNASTNNPALASSVGTKGAFYTVTTSGATSLDGNSSWSVGDNLFFDGTIWRKINGSGNVTIPSTNISDSTAAGRAILTGATAAAQRVSLNIDQAQLVVDTNQTITAAMEAVAWTSLSAPRIGSLPAAATFSQGQALFVYDESGNCSATNTITLAANGSDAINGAASYVLNRAFAGVALFRSSVAKWTALPFALFNPPPPWISETPSVRQTVMAGPIDANGFPTFLPATSGSLSITSQSLSSSVPLVVTSAQGGTVIGQTDLTGLATSNITWSALAPSTTNYLLVVVTPSGTLTPATTTLAPIYQQGGTASNTFGQITFIISSMTAYLGAGGSAAQYSVVPVAQVVTGASTVTSVTPYAYNGIYDGPYTATLPSSGLTAVNHNIGITPNTCEIFFKNTTAEFNYSIGDIMLARAGMGATSYETFGVSLTPMVANITSFANYSALNKTTAAGVALTAANWSWRVRATRGW